MMQPGFIESLHFRHFLLLKMGCENGKLFLSESLNKRAAAFLIQKEEDHGAPHRSPNPRC